MLPEPHRCTPPRPTAAGGLPSDWSDLAVLQGLDLSNNDLKGQLPASWGSLRDLQVGRAG